MEKSYTIRGKLFRILDQLAYKEYKKWETINKNKGRKQCFNSPKSCIVGLLSEYAVKLYIKEQRNENMRKVILKAFKERTDKNFMSDCDLLVEMCDKEFKVEVKGITKGQFRGQITPYHVNKYKKLNTDVVFFVEVDFDYEKEEAECIIYLKTTPDEILKWNIEKNHYGKDCYTYKES